MSAGKTIKNLLLGNTWGMSSTSAAIYVCLPLNLVMDVIVNCVLGIRQAAGSPARENWFSHWAFRDAYFGIRSERQGVVSLALNGLIPHVVGGKAGGMTTGQVVWARRKNWDWFDLPRMVEIWDIDGAAGRDAFESAAGSVSAVALIATTGGKVRVHATSWSRGFGNSVVTAAASEHFTDTPVAGEAFARGMIHLAEQLPEGFPTGDGTTLRLDEYTVLGATQRSVATIETSLSFILDKGVVQPGQVLHVTAPKTIPPPPPVIAKVKDVTTEPYDGFYHEIELDTVTLEAELPPAFSGGNLHVRRIVDTAGTSRSGPWQGGAAQLTQAEAETLPALRRSDLLRIEAGGGEISFASIDEIALDLHLTPPLIDPPEQPAIDLLRADASFTATLRDFTDPGKLTLAAGAPNVVDGDLLLVRLGDRKAPVVVTAKDGNEITIFPMLGFPDLELHNGTQLNVQRWVPTGENDRATFQRVNGDVISVTSPRASLFSKGSMVAFTADGKRAFREVEKMSAIALTLSAPATGAAPFTIEKARFDGMHKTSVDVVRRHRRLRYVSGPLPSTYGSFPQTLLGIRPRTRLGGGTQARETMFFTRDLANADIAHHRTWTPLTDAGTEFWLIGGSLPIEGEGSDTSWRFHPETANKFEGPLEVELVEYTKARASRVDGTPAGARIRVHAPEVQVPESPAVTDTHTRAVLEHELKHVIQCADWGPLMWMLPIAGIVKSVATFDLAIGSDRPEWAQRLLDNQGLDGAEYASLGGWMQLLYELFIPGETDTETWQTIFNPIAGALSSLIPDLDPEAEDGEKFLVAVAQLLAHAFDFRSWTPALGIQPWVSIDGDRSFLEQQCSRASGETYTTLLSAADRFNADYRTYFTSHTLRDADSGSAVGSVTRMMTWPDYTTRTVLSLENGNRHRSPVQLNDIGGGTVDDILSFTADAEMVVPLDLYRTTAGTVDMIEGPASLTRPQVAFGIVPAGSKITPRLRSFVPTPPRVNRSTGYFFVPASPARYTLTGHAFTADQANTNIVRLNVAEGNITLGTTIVPWSRPAAVGARPAAPPLRMPEGTSRLLTINGPITGWTADLDNTALFTLATEAQGWRITAPAFAPGVSVRVRLYRVLEPNDAAFDLTYTGVPTLTGVRSLLGTPVFIPVRDFIIDLVRAMKAEVILNGNPSPAAAFLGWSPRPATIRITEPGTATGPATVTLRNPAGTVGKVVFSSTASGPFSDTLSLPVPIDGTTVTFFVRGRFGSPSRNDKDAAIEVVNEDGDVVSRTDLMVRIRKNAMSLTDDERDRFISALAVFNGRGAGRFAEIRAMHTSIADPEAHGDEGFLPWHRAYVLDLERELQAIDPSVAIPYWKFDEPAPRIFHADFLGEPNPGGTVRFAPSNPLQDWNTDSVTGFPRTPRFDHNTEPAIVLGERATLNLGSRYVDFRTPMENDPHGAAHVSFSVGPIRQVPNAPRDPLFFLLHANVDRLWSKWQKENNRFDVTSTDTFPRLGRAGDPGSTRVGHNLLDTMWPWNGSTTPPRPPTPAPGGTLATSPVTVHPPGSPTVGDMIDWQGRRNPAQWQGFDYDNVDF